MSPPGLDPRMTALARARRNSVLKGLMHLIMYKWAETCYAINMLNKDIQPETVESFKNLKF
jgi:hypothetical protein